MKPYPLAALNHFTVPFSFICVSFMQLCECPVSSPPDQKAKGGCGWPAPATPFKSTRNGTQESNAVLIIPYQTNFKLAVTPTRSCPAACVLNHRTRKICPAEQVFHR